MGEALWHNARAMDVNAKDLATPDPARASIHSLAPIHTHSEDETKSCSGAPPSACRFSASCEEWNCLTLFPNINLRRYGKCTTCSILPV